MSQARTPLGLVTVVMAVLSVCWACPALEYPRCDKDAQCQGTEVCVFGECLACALDSHCQDGHSCKSYHCVGQAACTGQDGLVEVLF